jgi:hypothetical protein
MSTSAKFLLIAVGLAFALASPAEAAKKRRGHVKVAPPPVSAQAYARQGQNLFPPGPVYFGRDYLGDDPDPFIRSQILRDLGLHYGGDN